MAGRARRPRGGSDQGDAGRVRGGRARRCRGSLHRRARPRRPTARTSRTATPSTSGCVPASPASCRAPPRTGARSSSRAGSPARAAPSGPPATRCGCPTGRVRAIPVPDDLRGGPPDPPPGDLLVTAYDLLHSTGIDVGPYTRLAETFRDLILGQPVAGDPRPATFADGVANMMVLDAMRLSAASNTWAKVDNPGSEAAG